MDLEGEKKEEQAKQRAKQLSMSGEYGWELRQRLVPVGETPQRRLLVPPRDLMLLKTCRFVRAAGEASMWCNIHWIPLPLSASTLLHSELDPLLSSVGIHSTPAHSRDRMIGNIISLASSYVTDDGLEFTFDVPETELPLIEARIWDADDAVAREVALRADGIEDVLPEIWFASNPVDKLDELEEVEEDGGECSICLQELEVGQKAVGMQCLHQSFHSHCIARWLKRSNTCPLCRMAA